MDLEINDFDSYPHYVYATAFLANGKLADYSISNRKKEWGLRTFRGSNWENEVYQHGFIDKNWSLECVYNSKLVKNNKEHNEAFDELEQWLKEKFKNNKMKHVYF